MRTGTLFAAAAVQYGPAGSGAANVFTVTTENADYKSVTFSGCQDFRR